MPKVNRQVWVDLDNSPHVPFFIPIMERLRAEGVPVLATARDAYNVTDLVRLHQIDCATIGRHQGRNKAMKVAGLGMRAAQLAAHVLSRCPSLAVSHGSRAQMLASKLIRIPSVVIADYEHVTHVTRPDYLIVPEVFPDDAARRLSKNVLRYKGIKEDVYAATFLPNPSCVAELRLGANDIVVTARPPAVEAHYHVRESDELFDATLACLLEDPRTRVVLLPRNNKQKAALQSTYDQYLRAGKVMIPEVAVDGLNLVWHSDLVISGGGTMNREAAALGVPVYSTFRGPLGAVDAYLASVSRLVLLESPSDVARAVRVEKRSRETKSLVNRQALDDIVRHLVGLARRHS